MLVCLNTLKGEQCMLSGCMKVSPHPVNFGIGGCSHQATVRVQIIDRFAGCMCKLPALDTYLLQ